MTLKCLEVNLLLLSLSMLILVKIKKFCRNYLHTPDFFPKFAAVIVQ